MTTADRKRDLWSPFAALSDTTNNVSVTSVAAGGYHSIALTQSQVRAGEYLTLVLTADNKLYSFGFNQGNIFIIVLMMKRDNSV